MIQLTDPNDEAIVIALDDGTEIEIKITESENRPTKVLITAGESVKVVRDNSPEYLNLNPDCCYDQS